MELCTGGHLIDLMEKFHGELNEPQILFVLRDVAAGIHHMHSMKPPIAHRDIKVENILLESKKFKLCDFGSATTEALDYNTASKSRIVDQMESFERFTTLMYRPPEMIDQFFKYPVNEKVDIWMFGCVTFSLCYFTHPFQDAQKLGIVNAFYHFPDDPKQRISEKMKDFIRLMLTHDPSLRPNIQEVTNILDNWDKIETIKLNVISSK
jgi:AP2-associated kinase